MSNASLSSLYHILYAFFSLIYLDLPIHIYNIIINYNLLTTCFGVLFFTIPALISAIHINWYLSNLHTSSSTSSTPLCTILQQLLPNLSILFYSHCPFPSLPFSLPLLLLYILLSSTFPSFFLSTAFPLSFTSHSSEYWWPSQSDIDCVPLDLALPPFPPVPYPVHLPLSLRSTIILWLYMSFISLSSLTFILHISLSVFLHCSDTLRLFYPLWSFVCCFLYLFLFSIPSWSPTLILPLILIMFIYLPLCSACGSDVWCSTIIHYLYILLLLFYYLPSLLYTLTCSGIFLYYL